MARWFMLSYDAAQELYDLILTENYVQRGPRRQRYSENDFRKVIIKILRTKGVSTMREPVKTTIFFLDPSPEANNNIVYWENAFSQLGDEFKFVIGAIWQRQDGRAILREFPDINLNDNFQNLLAEVVRAEQG